MMLAHALLFSLSVLLVHSANTTAKWVPAKLSVTSDNAYAAYVGNSAGLKYMGSDFATQDSEIYHQIEFYPVGPFGKHDSTLAKRPLYLAPDHAIYVVAWSDAVDRQGLLMDLVIAGVQISSDNPEIRVYPTNLFRQPSGASTSTPACDDNSLLPFDRTLKFGENNQAPPCPQWVQRMIAQADMQNLWQTPTRGERNNGDSTNLFQKVNGIPDTSRWLWYTSPDCQDSVDRPFDAPTPQCHHKEPLLFKIPAAAPQVDPEYCSPTFNPNNGVKFCAGQCPLKPDGTKPNCASIFTPTGGLKECECCGQCNLVAMPNVQENYCAGLCPNCRQCVPSLYATNPQNPDQQYVAKCDCRPPQYDRCTVDRCLNKCVGTCPDPNTPCQPVDVDPDTNQIYKCDCVDGEECRLVQGHGEMICTGVCHNTGDPCKGKFYNGQLVDCSCDCCDLVRDAQDPTKNYCLGKCDDVALVCKANTFGVWTNPNTGMTSNYIQGCGCNDS